MGVSRVEELVNMLQSWVRIVQGREGTMVITVDRSFIRTMANNVRRLLVEQDGGQMKLEKFSEEMASR